MCTLATQQWASVSFNDVALAFLQAEWNKLAPLAWLDRGLIEQPDLRSPLENAARLSLLMGNRRELLTPLPTSTAWFRVAFLKQEHLPQLRVIGGCGFRGTELGHVLTDVAARVPRALRAEPEAWAPLVLWGHERHAPLTILEGNNRLIAYAASRPRPLLSVECYVGLSNDHCQWHSVDTDGAPNTRAD